MRVAIALLLCVVACVYADLPLCPAAIAKEYCGDGQTCCEVTASEIGCCPLPNASCCNGGVICCAQGYKCGPNNTCNQSDGAQVMAALAERRRHH